MDITHLVINEISYEIFMYGFIDGSTILVEMIGCTEQEAESIFSGDPEIKFINADNVESNLPKNHLAGFLDGAGEGNVRVILK